jgi:hypothetical protein
MRYFAYGSNLDPDQMRERCPAARFVCIARLDDHRLTFNRKSIRRGCGVADVIPSPGDCVWGAVFEVTGNDVACLDSSEGFRAGRRANAYYRKEIRVTGIVDDAEQATIVETYVAHPQPNPPPPSEQYMAQIVKGARHWGLPSSYIEQLLKANSARLGNDGTLHSIR